MRDATESNSIPCGVEVDFFATSCVDDDSGGGGGDACPLVFLMLVASVMTCVNGR